MGIPAAEMATVRITALLLGFVAAQVLAQPPAGLEVELVVDKAPDHQPHWLFLVFQPSPCRAVAQQNHCTGSPRDIAICIARSGTAIPPPCKQELLRGGLIHHDLELLHTLSVNSAEHPTQPLRQVEQEAPKVASHQDHHKPGHVHPIVEHLRGSCGTEINRITEQQDGFEAFCSLFAWMLLMLATCMC